MTSETETSIQEFVDREYQYGFVSREECKPTPST